MAYVKFEWTKNVNAHLFLKTVAVFNGTRGALLQLMRLLDYLLQMALQKRACARYMDIKWLPLMEQQPLPVQAQPLINCLCLYWDNIEAALNVFCLPPRCTSFNGYAAHDLAYF